MPSRSTHLRREHDRQHADRRPARTVTNRPKLSATITPKPTALRFHSSTDGTRRAAQADRCPGRRSAAARPAAERLGAHRRQRGQRDAEHRDDGVEVGVEHVIADALRTRRHGAELPADATAALAVHLRRRRPRTRLRAPAPARRPCAPPAPSASGRASGTRPSRSPSRRAAARSPTRAAAGPAASAFSSLRDRPVVDALEHPQHVDGRQDHAEARRRRRSADPSGTRRA